MASWCCLQTVAAGPLVMLMRMSLRLLHSCVHFSPSSIVVAAPSSSASVSTVVALSALDSSGGKMLSCRPMYAENLYFHSSNVA